MREEGEKVAVRKEEAEEKRTPVGRAARYEIVRKENEGEKSASLAVG